MLKEGYANNANLQFSANGFLSVRRRTVHDKQTGSDIVLSDEQVELVNRLQRGQFGDVNFNEYQVRSGDDLSLKVMVSENTCLCWLTNTEVLF